MLVLIVEVVEVLDDVVLVDVVVVVTVCVFVIETLIVVTLVLILVVLVVVAVWYVCVIEVLIVAEVDVVDVLEDVVVVDVLDEVDVVVLVDVVVMSSSVRNASVMIVISSSPRSLIIARIAVICWSSHCPLYSQVTRSPRSQSRRHRVLRVCLTSISNISVCRYISSVDTPSAWSAISSIVERPSRLIARLAQGVSVSVPAVIVRT